MLNKIIAEEKIQQAKSILEECDNIVIVSHTSPDGDALGSSLGLYHFLLQVGKNVNVIVPNAFPQFLMWMKGANDILLYEKNPALAVETIAASDLIFCLDFNTISRIDDLGPVVEAAQAHKVMIDHHLYPGDFCDVTISHPEISSTSELVFRFICRLGLFHEIDKSCAEAIYTGMMTDTGAFTYNSNDPHIYFIISELLRKGVNKDEIYDKVYNDYSEDRIRLQGFILYEKMKIYKDLNAALITLSRKEQKQFNWKKGDTEGFVNIPMSIRGIIFSVFIREEADVIRISLRSKGDFPSNEFAEKVFHGGGHLNASGGEFYGSLEEAVALFEKELFNYKQLLTK